MGQLHAGISFSNVLLTTLGPNGEQGGVAVELARELARRLNVPLEIIPYKASGLVAQWIEKSDVKGLSVAPKAAAK